MSSKINTSRSYFIEFPLLAAIFVIGFFTGALFHRQSIFPFPQLSKIIKTITQLNTQLPSHVNLFDNNLVKSKREYIVSIPVKFLPDYQIELQTDGHQTLLTREGYTTLNVLSSELALVLIDTWNFGDPREGEEPSRYLRSLIDILDKCREHGITIIHAPSHPVVDKYNQYHLIKGEVEKFMLDYANDRPTVPFLTWPPYDTSAKTWEIRKKGRDPWYKVYPTKEREISRFLRPLEDEFVLSSYNEFRYVLWKKRIKILLYVGGAVNECMLHRDA
jgi:hypothetical protein